MRYIADHDFHIHSTVSRCCHDENQTPETILNYAKENGLKRICLTNHFWDDKVGSEAEWIDEHDFSHVSSVLPLPKDDNVEFLFGCETEYVGQGRVALKKESAELFDFVLVPPHHFHMKNFVRPLELEETEGICRLMKARFLEFCNIEFAFGIVHPFMVLGYPGRIDEILKVFSDADFRTVYSYAAEKNKSVEINICALYQDVRLDSEGFPEEYLRMFTIARECGCRFHLGSDAHDAERLAAERFDKAYRFAGKCGILFPEDPFKA